MSIPTRSVFPLRPPAKSCVAFHFVGSAFRFLLRPISMSYLVCRMAVAFEAAQIVDTRPKDLFTNRKTPSQKVGLLGLPSTILEPICPIESHHPYDM
jgi:hypothetical protein